MTLREAARRIDTTERLEWDAIFREEDERLERVLKANSKNPAVYGPLLAASIIRG